MTLTKGKGKFEFAVLFNGLFSLRAGSGWTVDDLTLLDLEQLDVLVRTVINDEYKDRLYRHEAPMYRHAAQGTGWYGDDHYFERGGKEVAGPGWRKFCAERERLEKRVRDTDPFIQAPTPRPPLTRWQRFCKWMGRL